MVFVGKTIFLLAQKSVKMTVRRKSLRFLFTISTLLIVCSLLSMWIFSGGHNITYLSSSKYSPLSFDLTCHSSKGLSKEGEVSLRCKPSGEAVDSTTGGLMPADVLLNIIRGGSPLTENSNDVRKFASLLSSVMMNGLPLLGIDDFVSLSDFVNKNLGLEGRRKLMSYTLYRDKFGNFLDIRKKQLRIAPKSCWTDHFIDYLSANTNVFKV
jgi:hypothetical protein